MAVISAIGAALPAVIGGVATGVITNAIVGDPGKAASARIARSAGEAGQALGAATEEATIHPGKKSNLAKATRMKREISPSILKRFLMKVFPKKNLLNLIMSSRPLSIVS